MNQREAGILLQQLTAGMHVLSPDLESTLNQRNEETNVERKEGHIL